MVEKEIEIKVKSNVEGAKDLDQLKETLEALEKNSPTVNIPVNDEDVEKATKGLDDLAGRSMVINGKPVTIPVKDGDIDKAKGEMEDLAQQCYVINGHPVYVPVELPGLGEAEEGLENISRGEDKAKTSGEGFVNFMKGGLQKLNGGFTALASSIGLAGMAMGAWQGATERQNNTLLLTRKYGQQTANEVSSAIQSAVKKTPGDDTFLTSMLSNASLKAKMTKEELEGMAQAIADYNVMSKASGSSDFEAQGEIRNFLMTGETGRMRDTPLAPYLKDLEQAGTATERVKALNNALAQLGYDGASGMASASNSMEEFKGRLQSAQADLGQMFLPAIQGVLQGFNQMDESMNGALSKGIMAIGGLTTALSPAITTINQFSMAYGNAKKFIDLARDALTKDTISKKANAIQTKLSAVWERVGARAKMEKVKATLSSVGATAKESLSTAANSVKTRLSAMWDTLSSKAKNNKVRAALASAAASTREGIATALSTLKTKLSVVWQNIATIAKQMYAIVTGEATLMEYGFLAPLLLIIGAIAVLTAGIYLLGQHMGWWNDWGGFVDAFKARLMGLWNSFMGFVRFIQQGIAQMGNAWNNFKSKVISVGQAIYSGLTKTWSSIVSRITSFTSGLVSRIVSLFRSIPGHVSSALSGLYSALVRPFTQAFNSICGIVNNIKSQISSIPSNIGSFLGFGFNNQETDFTTGENFTELLNGAGSNNNSSAVININGIIENDAKEYIVNAVNDRLKKENLINGVLG